MTPFMKRRNQWKQQYDALLKGKIERLKAVSPGAREQLRGQFTELCKDIQGVLDEDPDRWHAAPARG